MKLPALLAPLLFAACASAGGESYTAPYVLDPGGGAGGADAAASADTLTSADTGPSADTQVERLPPDADGPGDTGAPQDIAPLPAWDGTPRVTAVTNQQYLETLQALLADATTSVRMVHYQMHDDSTIDQVLVSLGKAANRGVDVQVLLEGDLDFNPARVVQLEAIGCRARVDGPKHTTHAKLVVVDGEHTLVGSSNLSWMSVKNNNETNLLIDDTAAGAYYGAFADALWENDAKAPSLTTPSSTVVHPYCDGGYRGVATPLIKGAQSRVWVITYGMNLDSVGETMDLLVDARDRGVDVRVILEKSDFDDGLNTLNTQARTYLVARKVDARFESAETITHAKVLLVDDAVVIGTNNWGWSGFEDNHETGALTEEAGAVSALAAYFEGIWQTTTP